LDDKCLRELCHICKGTPYKIKIYNEELGHLPFEAKEQEKD